jgi:hypothetical protein
LSGLRRRSLSFLILIASALLIAPPLSRAQTTPPTNSHNCGATVEGSLAIAQTALQSKDKDTREALVCLIEATSTLNKRVTNDEAGHPQSGTLHMPMRDIVPEQYK